MIFFFREFILSQNTSIRHANSPADWISSSVSESAVPSDDPFPTIHQCPTRADNPPCVLREILCACGNIYLLCIYLYIFGFKRRKYPHIYIYIYTARKKKIPKKTSLTKNLLPLFTKTKALKGIWLFCQMIPYVNILKPIFLFFFLNDNFSYTNFTKKCEKMIFFRVFYYNEKISYLIKIITLVYI